MYGLPSWMPPSAVLALAETAGRVRELNERLRLHDPTLKPDRIGSGEIDAYFRQRWAVADLRAAAWDRGFPTLAAFWSAARPSLPYAVAYGIPPIRIGAFA
jgi:hypothetical protein